ncbi:hypothetical protein [Leptothoe spongobia]|uniref:Uncharacterized protein n=1 Tax=Leptothoe spongobia TAU-MAC 1115 TaxID=1967444 RepID=A0A947DG49_9CYAN|nr:hypothetical protein [Leptothoe spongobia]MBT9316246.1 hypothetical protein [Leptothoe spongobia TAU-MAC 1115]
MTKRLLFLISVVCGVLIAFTMSTSSFQTYRANEPLKTAEVAQATSAQEDTIRECAKECNKWTLGILCNHYIEVPFFPFGKPSCYREDWDFDNDGVMDVKTEEEYERALANLSNAGE